jgi:hypothetical protein
MLARRTGFLYTKSSTSQDSSHSDTIDLLQDEDQKDEPNLPDRLQVTFY